jgi:2-desacetyl-2-hydroxyethyl bacteriochlorophyllide A dehydrogenase
MKVKALVFRKANNPSIEEVDLPPPGDEQLTVKVQYSGVSIGTESSIFSGVRTHNGTFPLVPGYMASGIVEQVGRKVRELRAGDRVITSGTRLAGGVNSVFGGHASHHIADAGSALKIPTSVDMRHAALHVMPCVGLNAANMAGIGMQDTVLIQGQGLIGQLFGQWCSNRGARIIAIEPDKSRAALARKLVTDAVIDPKEEDVEARVMALTGGAGPTVVVEATASPKLLACATRFLRMNAKMIFLSWYPGDVTVTFPHFHNHQVTAFFPMGVGGQDGARATLAALAAGSIRMADNITDVYPYESAVEGYRRIINGDRSIMAMLVDWMKA